MTDNMHPDTPEWAKSLWNMVFKTYQAAIDTGRNQTAQEMRIVNLERDVEELKRKRANGAAQVPGE